MGRLDLVGQKFGRLTVRSFYDVVDGNSRWLCICDCGNECITTGNRLKRNITKSCGCFQKEQTSKARKKYNNYNLINQYGIGWTINTNKEFYFDLEDYDKIKDYCWLENDQGYITTQKSIRLHRLILDAPKNTLIDHINTQKYDNRKSNLRYADKSTNGINRIGNKNNKTGIKGVGHLGNKYVARIMKDYKNIHIGVFDTIENATKARNSMEIKLFGEFAYRDGENNE